MKYLLIALIINAFVTWLRKPNNMNRQPIQSSNIDEAGYDEKDQIMEVSFLNGGVYRYSNVPKMIWDEFLAANTPGEYFYHHIRSSYPYIIVGGGKPKGKGRKK